MNFKKPCKHAGCRTLVTIGAYCDIHKPMHINPYNNKYRALYDSKRWKDLSRDFLTKHCDCEKCGGNATECHHKTAHRGNLGLFYDKNNLAALCKQCHSEITASEIKERKNTK